MKFTASFHPVLRATSAIFQEINFPPSDFLWFSHNGTFKNLQIQEFKKL